MLGTEHNTQERIPVTPACRRGVPVPPRMMDIAWEGTCIVAAQQHLAQQGEAGYVDRTGALNPTFPDAETRLRYFAELGEELLHDAVRTAR
jgi:hypothetical protein